MKRLILGDGLLGSAIKKITGWDFISRKKDSIDFRHLPSYVEKIGGYDDIINCIAHTDTYSNDRGKHWDINYKGVADLTDYCNINTKKLTHISTDYIYSNSVSNANEQDVPVHCRNWYGYTKLLSDGYVQLKSLDYLLIRCSHKDEPFPYDGAFTSQIGNFDYVFKIASIIVDLINKDCKGVINVGTEVKTIYELALQTKPDVKEIDTLPYDTMPSDITMNLDKLKRFLNT